MNSLPAQPIFPSIRNNSPKEFGGVYARNGFAYQDQIAAYYCIKMLIDSTLKEVWCETYDDIVLILGDGAGELVEFVQVKAELNKSLWTIAKLCDRTKSATRPDGVGSSLLETSLARESCAEPARFLLVFTRQISKELELLTREFDHPDRTMSNPEFKALADSFASYVDGFKSPKGNNHEHWLVNGKCWDVAEEAIRAINERNLHHVLESMGAYADTALIGLVYENLLSFVKTVAEYKNPDLDKKKITRQALETKIKSWLDPYPNSGTEERLAMKLTDAGLDTTYVEAAKILRREYVRVRRSSGYLNLRADQFDDVDIAVQNTLLTQMAALDSTEITDSGPQFHHRCLKAVEVPDGVSQEIINVLPPGYGRGCMYQITARCRHRFSKLRP